MVSLVRDLQTHPAETMKKMTKEEGSLQSSVPLRLKGTDQGEKYREGLDQGEIRTEGLDQDEFRTEGFDQGEIRTEGFDQGEIRTEGIRVRLEQKG